MPTKTGDYQFFLPNTPLELQRGLHMVRAATNMSLRDWTLLALYRAIDEELRGWPEWRFASERGKELEFLRKGRKSLKHTKIRKVPEVQKAQTLPAGERNAAPAAKRGASVVEELASHAICALCGGSDTHQESCPAAHPYGLPVTACRECGQVGKHTRWCQAKYLVFR